MWIGDWSDILFVIDFCMEFIIQPCLPGRDAVGTYDASIPLSPQPNYHSQSIRPMREIRSS